MRYIALVCSILGVLLVTAAPVQAADPVRIAFVDTGNTGRSMMAEALAKRIIGEKHLNVQVISRAIDFNPYNIEPEPNAMALLKQHGIDVSMHRAAPLTAQDIRHSSLILTATANHKAALIDAFPEAAAKTFTMSEYVTGSTTDVADAFGKPMEVYEQVFSQISGYIPAVLAKAAPQP
jgi:protein-tyrosine phosphatase